MKREGQVMIIAIGILVFLAIMLGALVTYVQNESRWTAKEQRTTKAFQLAEGAVEQGYQNLLLSTNTWYDIQGGTPVTGYNFDRTYNGANGGQYEIRYSSSGTQQGIITGVGRAVGPSGQTEIRAVKALYTNGSSAENGITAGKTVTIGASVNVEWGSVVSYTSIDPGGRTYPRFYSAGPITGVDTNPLPSNSDGVGWWSYKNDLPQQPQVDLQYYKNLAINQGINPNAGCPAYYSNPGSGVNTNVTGCIDNQVGGRTYYFETGDWTWKNPGPNYILGNIILASGNMSISGNGGTGAAEGTYVANIPPQAWEEYGETAADWTTYTCMDAYALAHFPTYQDAKTAGYTASPASSPPATKSIPTACVAGGGSVLVHGFIYAGGGTGLNGGGNARFHGAVMTPNTATVNTSNFTIYFDNTVAANVHTMSLNLSRTSWQETSACSWTGTHPVCP